MAQEHHSHFSFVADEVVPELAKINGFALPPMDSLRRWSSFHIVTVSATYLMLKWLQCSFH